MSAATTPLSPFTVVNCRGRLLDLSKPVVMGILNCTPDSFFDGGKHSASGIIEKAEQMIRDGAVILDVGGQSSRPGAERISADEEWKRIEPVLQGLQRYHEKVFISCDTFYSDVAQRAIDAGVHMINDISFGRIDPALLSTVARNKVPYVLMHMQGEPQHMQANPQYDDVVQDVYRFFFDALYDLHQKGICDIIIDPGFGFGKTVAHNYALLKHLPLFKTLGKPILAGLSRKSMINRVLNTAPVDALNGTTALNMLALQQGAAILRVHDVKEAVQSVRLFHAFTTAV